MDQLGTQGASSIGRTGYYAVLICCLAVIAAFSYMTWYFHNAAGEASLVMIVIALPVLISLILLGMVLVTGKEAVAREIDGFFKRN